MSWLVSAWKLFHLMPRPIDYRDIADRTGMSDNQAQKCIGALVRRKCIVAVGGSARSGRRYIRVLDAQLEIEDRRGRTEAAREALARARTLRYRPSRPISQFTDRGRR